jgi:hypothetical protein
VGEVLNPDPASSLRPIRWPQNRAQRVDYRALAAVVLADDHCKRPSEFYIARQTSKPVESHGTDEHVETVEFGPDCSWS